MPPITFNSSDDELELSELSPCEGESLEADHPCAHEGNCADVLREGELQDNQTKMDRQNQMTNFELIP